MPRGHMTACLMVVTSFYQVCGRTWLESEFLIYFLLSTPHPRKGGMVNADHISQFGLA